MDLDILTSAICDPALTALSILYNMPISSPNLAIMSILLTSEML